MQGKLIAELMVKCEEVNSAYQRKQASADADILAGNILEILSRHEAEQGEGLREAIWEKAKMYDLLVEEMRMFKSRYETDAWNGPFIRSCHIDELIKTKESLEKRIGRFTTVLKMEYDCLQEFWLSNRPAPDKAAEPLAVFAYHSGYRIEVDPPSINDGRWGVSVHHLVFKDSEVFYAPTYALAEAKARAYLEALPDKGGE